LIRGREKDERHLEVLGGNVETDGGGMQVFGAVAKSDTDISALLSASFCVAGRAVATAVTAFTDGCPLCGPCWSMPASRHLTSADWTRNRPQR